jgi:adenine/guanine phosphoribosyltransferase-like PRPP-binding protein
MREVVTAKRLSSASPYRDRIIPAADMASPPAAPYAQHYTLRLPDGDWVELPLVALPPDETTAIVSLCITENSFDLEDRLSTAMTALARRLRPDVIVGIPTLGLVLAASVAKKLGHPYYVPLSYSRKFWFDDALSVSVNSITSPGREKKVYLDPRLLERLASKRVVVIEDVVSTGTTILAQLALLAKVGIQVEGIVTAMQESRVWMERLAAADPTYPQRVHSVLRSPLFNRFGAGWVPDPATLPDASADMEDTGDRRHV